MHKVPVESVCCLPRGKEKTMAVTQSGNHTHLTLSDRIYIEQALERRMTFKDIAVFIGKDPSTISKKIRHHRSAKETERKTALCELQDSCTKKHMCNDRYCNRLYGKCTQSRCHNSCSDYPSPVCRHLETAPYVCNGCGIRSCRQLIKLGSPS